MYEAKYNVLKIGPKQEVVTNSDVIKTSPASTVVLAITGDELAGHGAPAPQTSLPNTREQRISVLGITAKNGERGGAEIVEVEPGGVAETAYLHVGDIINSLNGRPIKDSAQLDVLLSNRDGKREVRLGYLYRSISFGYVHKETVVILGVSR
jgi:C-terminal processing protease CtpA/Prc